MLRLRQPALSWPAVAVAAALAAAYLVIAPPSADLAAQLYRTQLFEGHGFTLWDTAWYGGHHMPGYSLLFPPLAALLGARLAGALSAVAAAALFERLARDWFGERARLGALWFGAATATNLFTGRLAFGLGITVALAALLAASRGRLWIAAALGVLTAAASPVAGLFLAMAAAAWWLARRTPGAVALGLAAALPVVALSVAFPEGGVEPFVASAFWPALALLGAVFLALPAEQRELRVGIALYAAVLVVSYAVDSPMGGNVTRLGALFAGPVLACVILAAPRRAGAVALLALPLLYWQWHPPVRDWARANDDPSIQASYYDGMLRFLGARHDGPFRVEVPFTANHWEARYVAARFPLARGWERQLDMRDNALFYRPSLGAGAYRSWLERNAVRYVALPDVRLDHSALAEARLIRSRPRWLRPVWRDRHWQVFAVRGARPLADGARLVALGTQDFELATPGPATAIVRVRFTPYWKLVGSSGCVSEAPGGWTRVQTTRGGRVRVAARFALGRVLERGPRCTRA